MGLLFPSVILLLLKQINKQLFRNNPSSLLIDLDSFIINELKNRKSEYNFK